MPIMENCGIKAFLLNYCLAIDLKYNSLYLYFSISVMVNGRLRLIVHSINQ